MKQKKRLIVIEGTDGSGKATQTKLLVSRLQENKYSVKTLSFPQYGKKSAGMIEEYLNGTYGDPRDVSPHAASFFYAVDRFDASFGIRRLLEDHIVVLDRYVDSNAGHQGGKIADAKKRMQFLTWLYDTEYGILNIPKPDLVLILHVPADIGQRMVAQKQLRSYIKEGTHDKHEADLEHLKNAEASYLWLARQFPQDHKVIECIENGALLAPDRIHEKIWTEIRHLLS